MAAEIEPEIVCLRRELETQQGELEKQKANESKLSEHRDALESKIKDKSS